MKTKKILLPLVLTVFGLTGCELSNDKPTIIATNHGGNTNTGESVNPNNDNGGDDIINTPQIPEDDVEIVPSKSREELLEAYKPESFRGFDNISQFAYNAYLARAYSREKNRVYNVGTTSYSDSSDYTFDLDENGDGSTDFVGYPIYERNVCTFEHFTYFDFNADDCDFLEENIGLGKIQALIVEDSFFGEIMLVLKHGDNYFACAEVDRSSNTSSFGIYKHYNHFFMCKDLKAKDYKIKVTYEGNYQNHTSITKIKFGNNEFTVIPESVVVDNSRIDITLEEQIDYLNEFRPNSNMPDYCIRYRLPDYEGSDFTCQFLETSNNFWKGLISINNTNTEEINNYIELLRKSGFTNLRYGANEGYTKPYDRNYDLYLMIGKNSTYIDFRVYLIPYMNIESATPENIFPTNLNGLIIPVNYTTQNGRFYLKTIDDYQCIFIYGSDEGEMSVFREDLISAGLSKSSNGYKMETDKGIYEIIIGSIVLVPYQILTIKKIG